MYKFLFFVGILCIISCQSGEKADMIIINTDVYTVNKEQPTAEAVAIKGNRILKVGSNDAILNCKDTHTRVLDAKGQFVMPGFIEGHAHFTNMGKAILNLNFLKSENWKTIVQQVAQQVENTPKGVWIEGRGWHQEKWNNLPERQLHGYPYHDALSAVSPEHPVILFHASGHSLFANAKAMEMAGVSLETPNPKGGEIVRDATGKAIGVFEERAMEIIMNAHQAYLDSLPTAQKYQRWLKGIQLAQKECLSKGITSFQDAGSTFQQIEWYKNLAEQQQLDIRLWAMIRHSYDDMKNRLQDFPLLDIGNHHFTVRAIKSEVDGALGAFGAWLLRPYSDKPSSEGKNTTSISEVKNIAELAYENKLQFCVHAIGDRANRVTLNIMEEQFQKNATSDNLRWRIEHAQHLHPNDIPRFKELNVIASMQGVHCTSDAPFVVSRLGEERTQKGAYPWRSLLDAGVTIANGTDAPVEDIDPLASFYASVTRKRADTGFTFFPEQAMTRAEAIYSYTLGNAYAAFEETQKGSIETGKLADLVILSNNLLNCSDDEILPTRVLYTLVGGTVKYESVN